MGDTTPVGLEATLSLARTVTPIASARRRWPSWAGYAASAWALLYGSVLLAVAVTGGTLYDLPYLIWVAVAVLFAGAGMAAATVRPCGRRLPPWVVSAGLWTVLALAVAGSVFVLLNLIALVVTGSLRGRDGHADWGAFTARLSFVVVAVLFLMTALSWRHRTRNTCPDCGGQAHQPGAVAAVERTGTPASQRVRRIAHLGGLAFIPYYVCHFMRFADAPPFRGGDLAAPGDPFIPAAIIGTVLPAEFLLLGLVHSWGMIFPRWTLWLSGRRVPRFLPLIPVWLIAPTLAAYGTGAWVYVILQFTGVLEIDGTFADYLLGCSAATAFAGYGWALAIAAVSYQRRTRPRCILRQTL
ncbi:hypothetical protein [Actinophytocola xanthii]|uniref:Uncharacterized protein n=1 Tax=Actinophytocola xanthii TaxID=1912961 RepID=A0A1Q8BT71_9PSEU|nr:hypothetical protein [Actinophytocola xanthii]OLF05299.1 hypothetical protein BU204_37250 [Actinophytocola xanthii]